jgi:CheY-like chemotaxis protein
MAGCKILIIDDDTDDVEILAEAFTQSGVDGVHYVHTAIQAFMYLESLENPEDLPKLIVTDLYLPGITGSEFLKDLKQMEKYKGIHVIVLTSTKTDKEIQKYKQLGAIDYLIKPSSYEEYVEVANKISQRVMS